MQPTTASAALSPCPRVAAALEATPPDYLMACLRQRVRGLQCLGSMFLGFDAPEALLEALRAAPWAPYEHPALGSDTTAFSAPFEGEVGVVELASLPADARVRLEDPKGIGQVEAVVAGQRVERADFAVIVLGIDEGAEIVFTFFPGAPIRPSQLDAAGRVGMVVSRDEAVALGLHHAKIEATP